MWCCVVPFKSAKIWFEHITFLSAETKHEPAMQFIDLSFNMWFNSAKSQIELLDNCPGKQT